MVGGTRGGVGSVTRASEVVKTVKVVGKSSSAFIPCVFSVLYTPSKSSECASPLVTNRLVGWKSMKGGQAINQIFCRKEAKV